jgi:integrase
MSTAPRPNQPLQLKLFVPGESNPESGFSPKMRLSQFFYNWFLPIILEAEQADEGTIKLYVDALSYWIAITGDPPLEEIDDELIAEFKKLLPSATYQRGPLAPTRKLVDGTIKKHLRSIRAILYRCGPPTDPKRKLTKKLLPEVPHIQVGKPSMQRKASFELSIARAIIEATYYIPQTRRRRKLSLIRLGQLLRAIIFALYYIGERSSSIFALDWRWVEYRADGPWINIPAEAVDKTEKPLEKALHADALAAFEELRTGGNQIIPWPHSYSHFSEMHDLLQKLAGVPEQRLLSPHAWRRTHGRQIGLLGAQFALDMAQRGLNHSSPEITEQHYASFDAEFTRRLPSIRIDPKSLKIDPGGQTRLF